MIWVRFIPHDIQHACLQVRSLTHDIQHTCLFLAKNGILCALDGSSCGNWRPCGNFWTITICVTFYALLRWFHFLKCMALVTPQPRVSKRNKQNILDFWSHALRKDQYPFFSILTLQCGVAIFHKTTFWSASGSRTSHHSQVAWYGFTSTTVTVWKLFRWRGLFLQKWVPDYFSGEKNKVDGIWLKRPKP